MATSKTKYLIWFMALALIMACVPTFTAPNTAPTTDPNAINTFIVQTANAASTQTAAAMPTLTSTPLFTSTPLNTDTPEPTATSTVIFLFYTPSPVILVTQPSGGGNASSRPYACEVLSVTPANGTVLGSRTDFDAKWRVKNIGQREWDRNSVDYVYFTGDKFHKVAGYDLEDSVPRGDIQDLVVDMLAPKNAGTYTTNWTLRIGSDTFCTLSLTIVVN